MLRALQPPDGGGLIQVDTGSNPPKKITLADVHSAIETLAIQQAEIGIAVLFLLSTSKELPEELKSLPERVTTSVEKLHELANKLLDAPYGP